MRCAEEEESAILKADAAEFCRLGVESDHGFTANQTALESHQTV